MSRRRYDLLDVMLLGTFLWVGGAASVLITQSVRAQEQVTLTTPITQPSVTGLRVRTLILHLGDPATVDDDTIIIDLDSTTPGVTAGTTTGYDGMLVRRETYSGAQANTNITALNKANLTTRSLNQRIFDRLIADARLAGTVTGAVP